MIKKAGAGDLISQVTVESWKDELEKTSSTYHFIAAWVAIIFDPVFAFTDYINIPESWKELLFVRLGISVIVLSLLLFRKKLHLPSYFIVAVTFLLISLQNSYTYSLIGNEDIIGHNLNYIALLIGASMFLLWELKYSIIMVLISIVATAFFLNANKGLDLDQFLVQGGVLLFVVAIFMIVLIRARYKLIVKERKARLALQESNEEIQAQNEEIISQGEEIRVINENLEKIVLERTKELEKKNKALEEYAFINAHKLRSPVASILGLVNLLKKTSLDEEAKSIMPHLLDSTGKLDDIVADITKTIERGERGNKKY
jgi:signal transduction histidine kinase